MKHVWQRTLSLLLAIVMILGNFPVSALATETGEEFECQDHANAQVVEFTDATCSEDGCALWACPDCGQEWEETIPATGLHTYDAEEAAGEIVYTCAVCGSSYSEAVDVPEEVAEETPEEAPAEEPEEIPEETPVEEPEEIPVEIPEEVIEVAPPVVSNVNTHASASQQRDPDDYDGVVWVEATEDTTVANMLPVALRGGIKKAVLRAMNLIDQEKSYTVYYQVEGELLNVGDPVTLAKNQKKAEQLADDMKAAAGASGELLHFILEDKNGVTEDVYIKLKSSVNTDFFTVNYGHIGVPEDLQAVIEGKVQANAKVDGFTLAELAEMKDSIQVTVNPVSYSWPSVGGTEVFNDLVTVTIYEGMTGVAKTVSGGSVILEDTTPSFTVTYKAHDSEGNEYVYDSFEQYQGEATKKPAEAPYRNAYYTFLGWKDFQDKVTGHVTYVAEWKPGQDAHTPGVNGNGISDGIDDREQKFIITYYDDDEVTVLETVPVLYGEYLTPHPSAGIKEGYQFVRWVAADGLTGYVARQNRAFKAEWVKVWNITYNYNDDGATDPTVYTLKNGVAIRKPADPVREGYVFDGWEYQGEGNAPTTATADVTFTAKWIKLHTITYTDGMNGEVFKDFTITAEEGDQLIHPAVPGTRDGYVAKGWEVQSGEYEGAVTGNVTFVPVWDAIEEDAKVYTITYKDGDNIITAVQLLQGDSIVHPADPVKDGYAFVEWVYDGEGDAPTTADGNATFKATWIKVHTITYTDGVADEVVFENIIVTVKDGESFKDPAKPEREGYTFQRWEQSGGGTLPEKPAGDMILTAIWEKKNPESVTVTYFVTRNDGTLTDVSEDVPYGKEVDPEGFSKYIEQDKMAYLGWYYANENGALVLEGESEPVADVENYVKLKKLPKPLDLATLTFTEDTCLRLVSGKDANGNGHIDGAYKYENGVATDDRDVTSTYQYYSKYKENYGYPESDRLKGRDFTLNELDYNDGSANEKLPIPDTLKDDTKFVKWMLGKTVETEVEYNEEKIIVAAVHYIVPETAPDLNRNGNFDSNEEALVMVNVNGAYTSYANFIKQGIGTINVDHINENGVFPVNVQNGTTLTVTPAEGYMVSNIEVDGGVEVEVTPGNDGSLSVVVSDTDAEVLATPDEKYMPEYSIVVYFETAQPVDGVSLTIGQDGKYTGYTAEEVYKAVMNKDTLADGETVTVDYVAREAQKGENAVIVSIEAVYQWLSSNYSDSLVSMLDSYMTADLSGIEVIDGKHVVKIDVEEIKKPVDAMTAEGFVYKSVQDVANEKVNAYINRFVDVMSTDPDELEENAVGNTLMELMLLKSDISDAVNAEGTQIGVHPFGYNAEGKNEFTEILDITYENKNIGIKNAYNGVVMQLADGRAAATLSGKTVNTTYGAAVDAAIKGNTSAKLPVSYAAQAAGQYDAVSLVIPGTATNRPASAVCNVNIAKADATIEVPERVVKDHNEPYTTSPAPVTTPAGLEVISILVGLDMNGIGDAELNREEWTIGNLNPKMWVKLPNTVLNLLDLVKSFKDMADGKELDGTMQKLLDFAENFDPEKGMEIPMTDAVDMLKTFVGDNEKLNEILAKVDGTIKVEFSGAYPEDVGAYLNVAIAADANYKNGVNTDMTEGKDFGLVLITPVLVKPNNGIQLVSDEVEGAQNVFSLDYNGEPHALYVKDHKDVPVYYYGITNGMDIHYEKGTTAPTESGLYLAAAVITETENGEIKLVASDMAIVAVGMRNTSVEVERTVLVADGEKHAPKITVTAYDNADQSMEDVSSEAATTVITGRISQSDKADLSELTGIVNINLPARVDNMWTTLVGEVNKQLGTNLGDNITEITLTPAQTLTFLNKCKEKAANIDEKLSSLNVIPESILTEHSPEAAAIRMLNAVITRVEKIEAAIGDNVEIQFKNENAHSENGIYLYEVIVTDPNYLPSEDHNVMVLHAAEEDFILEDQTVAYTGEGQVPEIEDKTDREHFLVIYNENTLLFVLNDMSNAILEKLKAQGVKDGMTVGDLFEGGEEKLSKLVDSIVDGLIDEANKIIAKFGENSIIGQAAKDKLNERLNSYQEKLVQKVRDLLTKVSHEVNDDTVLRFNQKPVVPGKYQVHAFSYAIAHEEATFTIAPEITVTANDVTITAGETPEFGYTPEIKPESMDMPEFTVTYKVYKTAEENGETVKGEEVTDLTSLAAGTYIIEPYAELEGYVFVFENGVLKVASAGKMQFVGPSLNLESEIHYNFDVRLIDFDMEDVAEIGLLYFATRADDSNDSNYDTADYRVIYDTPEEFQQIQRENGEYRLRSKGIPAKNMGDDGWYKLYVKTKDNKIVYGSRLKFSAKIYADNVLKGNFEEKDKNIVVALMNYGAAAQVEFKYNMSNLMNAHLSEENLARVESYDEETMIDERIPSQKEKHGEFVRSADVFVKSYVTNLTLEGAISLNIRMPYTTEQTPEEIGMLIWSQDDYLSVEKLTWENATYKYATDVEDEIKVSFSGMAAKEAGKTVFACGYVLDNGIYTYSGVQRMSIDYYAQRVINNAAQTDTMKELAKHLAVYCEYAEKYFYGEETN